VAQLPTPENKTASIVNSVIKAGNCGIKNVTEALLIAKFPFLGIIGIRQVFGFIMSYIFGTASEAEQNGATFAIIDSQVAGQQSDFKDARAALIAAKKSGNPDEIKKAIKAYADAHSAAVHYDGESHAK
jgi:hypothetical protein